MKTGLYCDLRQRKFSSLDETNGLLNTLPQDKLMRWHTDRRAKQARKMEGRHMRLFCQSQQRNIFIQV